jgi:hypothetical protein
MTIDQLHNKKQFALLRSTFKEYLFEDPVLSHILFFFLIFFQLITDIQGD